MDNALDAIRHALEVLKAKCGDGMLKDWHIIANAECALIELRKALDGSAAAPPSAGRSNALERRCLEEISALLPCENPCDWSEKESCKSCGHDKTRSPCCGCMARAALAGKDWPSLNRWLPEPTTEDPQ